MKKIKIIHILSRLDTGGLENGVVNLCNYLRRDVFVPSVCCLKSLGLMAQRLKSDVKIIDMHFQEGKDFLRPLKMAAFFFKEKPDIVHTHGWGQGSFESIIGARLAGVAVIINGEHGSFFKKNYQIFLQKILANLCNISLAVSESLKKEVISRIGIKEDQIKVIYNGVNTELFNTQLKDLDFKKTFFKNYNWDINESYFIIVNIGSLKPQKNQLMLLQTVKTINERFIDNNIKVLLVGDGPDKSQLSNYINNNNLQKQIIMLGERQDVHKILSLAQVLVLTSIPQWEGLSNVILEAMSSGVPVLATKSVGSSELVLDNNNGFLLDSYNIEQLVEKITLLSKNNDLLQLLSTNARVFIENKFSIDKMVSSYENIYLNNFKCF